MKAREGLSREEVKWVEGLRDGDRGQLYSGRVRTSLGCSQEAEK